jgi:hypothetical protein
VVITVYVVCAPSPQHLLSLCRARASLPVRVFLLMAIEKPEISKFKVEDLFDKTEQAYLKM